MNGPLLDSFPKAGRIPGFCAALALAAALDAGAENFIWRGTADNPVWDTSTANWASDASTSARKAWVNNASSSGSNPKFDSQGARDITVDAAGVEGFQLTAGGTHTLSGGPVTVKVFDLGSYCDLTISNRVNCTDTTAGWGFRMYGGNGTVTVADGGYLDAYFSPWSADYSAKLVVLTGGTFRATFNKSNLNNSNHPTIYFDGGTLLHTYDTYQNKVTFGNTKMVLGAGGVHIAERVANGWTYLPGPIGPADDLPAGVTDGGLIVDNLSSSTYVYMQNFAHTFRGGLHLRGTGGCVGVEANAALGATPSAPADNIFFEGASNTVSTILAAHGNVTLNANRNLRIGNGVTAAIGAYNGSSALTIKGTISCENPQTSFLITKNYSGTSTGVTFDPGAGRTNHIGRLRVQHPLTIASGTTLLESTQKLPSGDVSYGGNNDSPLHVQSGGTLTVSGGELLKTGGRICTQNGTLVVSGGVVDLTGTGGEILHANSAPATTTVKNGGRLNVGVVRIGGAGAGTDATKSVLNLETGGVVRVANYLYVHPNHTGYKATVNCNGGTLEWANTAKEYAPYASNTGNSGSIYGNSMAGIAWNVLEGGLVVSNDCNCYFTPALKSGAAKDGGVTKWGRATFALRNTGNDFNGPVSVMQGSFRLGSAGVIPATGTARVAAGAAFYMNTFSQTLARIEGSGTFREVVNNGTKLLTVTSAIAPGMGADALGTLTISGGAINIADGTALEIDVDAQGNSDCLSYPADLDLSKMALHVNDGTKLNKDYTYTIARLGTGAILTTPFASVAGLPESWHVKYDTANGLVQLRYTSPFTIIVR